MNFCSCGCGGDEAVCQQCGRIGCHEKMDFQTMLVPRSKRQGNVCKHCRNAGFKLADADVKLAVQELFSHQQQIYPDACDVGIVINRPKRSEFALRECVRNLIKSHKPKITSWTDGRTYDFGSFEISWNRDRSRKVEFLSASFN